MPAIGGNNGDNIINSLSAMDEVSSTTTTNGQMLQTDRSEIRREALELSNRKTRIENEIRDNLAILQTQGVGMNDPLVDNEGFPRNDIDIHLIRQTRQKIICLRNDLNNLISTIEELLSRYFN